MPVQVSGGIHNVRSIREKGGSPDVKRSARVYRAAKPPEPASQISVATQCDFSSRAVVRRRRPNFAHRRELISAFARAAALFPWEVESSEGDFQLTLMGERSRFSGIIMGGAHDNGRSCRRPANEICSEVLSSIVLSNVTDCEIMPFRGNCIDHANRYYTFYLSR